MRWRKLEGPQDAHARGTGPEHAPGRSGNLLLPPCAAATPCCCCVERGRLFGLMAALTGKEHNVWSVLVWAP